jgi:hypothetical protein
MVAIPRWRTSLLQFRCFAVVRQGQDHGASHETSFVDLSQPTTRAGLIFCRFRSDGKPRCSSSILSPKEQSLASRVQGNDAETEKYGSAHSWLVTCRGGCMTGQVWVASGGEGVLTWSPPAKHFRKAPFSPYFPCFPSVTRYGAFPAPGGTRRSASRCARPSGLGFQTKNLPRKNTRGSNPKNGRDFFFGASAERHAFGTWERGTSRRFAQECPEGNPGKYKQGEITWHATKTKSR